MIQQGSRHMQLNGVTQFPVKDYFLMLDDAEPKDFSVLFRGDAR
jgi:hypothetical protein